MGARARGAHLSKFKVGRVGEERYVQSSGPTGTWQWGAGEGDGAVPG
jgi:hypothetical protein